MRDLIPQPVMAKIITYKTCEKQTGGGRWTKPVLCRVGPSFDDKAHILKEARAWGLETYAMEPGGPGPYKRHGHGSLDFTMAVDQWK